MLKRKSILSIFLAVMLLTSCLTGFVYADNTDDEDAIPYFEDLLPNNPDDEKTEDFSNAIKLLTTLGIMDETTVSSENITKGQFASIVIKTLNLQLNLRNLDAAQIFSDVEEGTETSAAILACYDLGLMHGNGDGTFGPDELLTYGQAVKVVVSMLGYGVLIDDTANFMNYFDLAAKYKVNKGIVRGVEDIITGDVLAQLIYNALDVETIALTTKGIYTEYKNNNGETLLNRHDIEKIRGIVNETPVTSLTGASTLRDGKVRVGGTVCDINGTNILSYFGYEVYAYVRTDKDDEFDPVMIYAEATNANESLVIDGDNWIEAVANDNQTKKVRFTIEANTYSATIAKEADYIYQNVANPYFDITGYKPVNGEVTMIDNDRDGIFDVVFVNEYQTYVVESIGNYKKTLNCDAGTIALDPDDNTYEFMLVKDGMEIGFDAIKIDDVLSVTEGVALNGTIYKYVVVCDKKLVGTIAEIEKIGDVSYITIGITSSKVLPSVQREFYVGDEGSFLQDFRGNVAAFRSIAGSSIFGYVIGVRAPRGIVSEAMLKILAQDSTVREYKTASTLKFDGARIQAETLLTGDNYTKINRQMILFKMNTDGTIIEILSKLNPAQDPDGGLAVYKKDGITNDDDINGTVVSRRYNSNVPVLFMTSGAEDTIRLSPTVMVFAVPADEAGAEDDKYKVTNQAYFVNRQEYSTEVFNYDKDTYSTPLVLVRRNTSPDIGNSSPSMVTDIRKKMNEDDEVYYEVYLLDKSGEKMFPVSDELFERVGDSISEDDISPLLLNKGDLVKYAQSDGEIVKMERELIYSNDIISKSQSPDYRAEPAVTTGRVVRVDEKIVTIKYLNGDQWMVRHYNTSPVSVVGIYDPAGKGSFISGTIADLEKGDTICIRSSDGYVTAVFGYKQQ